MGKVKPFLFAGPPSLCTLAVVPVSSAVVRSLYPGIVEKMKFPVPLFKRLRGTSNISLAPCQSPSTLTKNMEVGMSHSDRGEGGGEGFNPKAFNLLFLL
jgi:hypothetical protein